MKYDVAIVGAGMAGLTAAKTLAQSGKTVVVVEKSRGTGGRLSSKRLQLPNDQSFTFDLGCSEITYSSESFKEQLASWYEDGVIEPSLNHVHSWVGRGRNSGITRHLAKNIDVKFSTRVEKLDNLNPGWRLMTSTSDKDQMEIEAEQLILAVPPQQAVDLLPEAHNLKEEISRYSILPQWVVLLALESDKPLQIGESMDSVFQDVSAEHAKRELPENSKIQAFQIKLSTEWSKARTNWEKEKVADHVVGLFKAKSNFSGDILATHTHRWLYSIPDPQNPHSTKPYLSSPDQLHICGDYLSMSQTKYGVEAAYLSGKALAECLSQD